MNTMNEQTCRHEMSGWDWRVTRSGEVETRVSETPDGGGGGEAARWARRGKVLDVLARVTDKAFESTVLTWRTELSYSEVERVVVDRKTRKPRTVVVTVCNDSDGAIDRIRADDLKRELRLLSVVGEAIGRRLDATRWRMCSPNACMHFQFGPGVTVATDGVQVVVFGFARFGTDCAVVHRGNVIGPVTASPVRTAEWDYIGNKPGKAEPGERKAPKREEGVARAMAALLA